MTLQEEIAEMQERGSSLEMHWSKHTGTWSCHWSLGGGKYYAGFSRNLENAVHDAKEQENQERAGGAKGGETCSYCDRKDPGEYPCPRCGFPATRAPEAEE